MLSLKADEYAESQNKDKKREQVYEKYSIYFFHISKRPEQI